MRIVPLNKLLLQPRVHLQWMRQDNLLRFVVGEDLAHHFDGLWRAYVGAGYPPPTAFLEQHPLTEDDHLFALFAGAVFAREHLPDLAVEIEDNAVVWRG